MPRTNTAVRVPLTVSQARVLRVLCPEDGRLPLLTVAKLKERVGFTSLSGTVTRVLNGLKEGSSSGKAHKGLLALGYAELVELDIDGVLERCVRATEAGRRALGRVEALPEMRSREASTNKRYQGKGEDNGEH